MQKNQQTNDSLGIVLPEERRRAILAQLTAHGRVVSSLLARAWDISEDTIRRDIRELDDAGLVRRVHGGALPLSPQLRPYNARAESNVTEKTRLGARGALSIGNGMTALLYGGTTVLEAARQLRADLRARIVTNDPRIALEVAGREGVETILLGGRLFASSQLIVGAQAIDDVRGMRADVCLIGACAVHDEFGLGINDIEEAGLLRAFIAASSEVVGLVTSDKLQTVAPFRVTSAAAITHLVTSASVDAAVLNLYRDLAVRIDCV